MKNFWIQHRQGPPYGKGALISYNSPIQWKEITEMDSEIIYKLYYLFSGRKEDPVHACI